MTHEVFRDHLGKYPMCLLIGMTLPVVHVQLDPGAGVLAVVIVCWHDIHIRFTREALGQAGNAITGGMRFSRKLIQHHGRDWPSGFLCHQCVQAIQVSGGTALGNCQYP